MKFTRYALVRLLLAALLVAVGVLALIFVPLVGVGFWLAVGAAWSFNRRARRIEPASDERGEAH